MPRNYIPKHRATGGYVYLIRMGETAFHKIGISMDDIEARLLQLQVSSPFDLYLISSHRVSNPVLLEREIHRALAYCRVRGEWFQDTNGDVIKVFEEYGGMAVFDEAIKLSALLHTPQTPQQTLNNQHCPNCSAFIADRAQWLAARRWGHCAACK